ncbi:hypothetical protein M3Y95_00289100 [Aphelenchoides besseyi]|nr:hypothetical protein M3Y95_00289100 [Aphelenchoides besseyi]
MLFGFVPQFLIDFFVNAVILIICGLIYSTCSLFVYRYLQTTQSRYLAKVSNIRLYLLSHVINAVVVTIIVLIPLNFQLLSNDELHEVYEQMDPEAAKLMRGHVCIGFDARTGKEYVVAGINFMIFFFGCSLVILVTTVLVYSFLHHSTHSFSPKTVALFRSLINMLVLDLVFAAITGWTTITVTVISFFTQMETGAYVIFFSLIIADIYPLFNQCLVICFVEPYRLAAVQFLRIHWLFGVEKETQWETALSTRAVSFEARTRRSIIPLTMRNSS